MPFAMHAIFACEFFLCQMGLFMRASNLLHLVWTLTSDQISEKCQAIVGDGLSMGRPCCGVFRCKEPLLNNCHRFCAEHQNLHGVCAIKGCENPVVELITQDPGGGPPKVSKKKTCSLPVHQQIETKHQQRSTGSFLYKQRLQHAQVSQPIDSFSGLHHVQEQDLQEDFESYHVRGQEVVMNTIKNPGTIGVDDDTDRKSVV